MARYINVHVEGDEIVAAKFKRLGLKSRDLQYAFGRIANTVRQDAYGFAPKVSGRLAGSIRAGAAKTKATVAVGSKAAVPYAGPINFGWAARNIEASLFMQRAADTKAEYAAGEITTEMRRQIAQVGLD